MAETTAILIVEDDQAIATGLELNLRLEGYAPSAVTEGGSVPAAIRERQPGLILLDLSLPDVDGLEVLSQLRQAGDHTPVIVLSARESEHDKVAALRLGADDYVTKPFALAELMARVAAVLRRSAGPPARDATPVTESAPGAPGPDHDPPGGPPDERLSFGDVSIDLATRTTTRSGAEVRLTHLEFELLLYFARHPDRVLSRERLLRNVWGIRRGGSTRTVDNFVAQLRSKLEMDPDHPTHITTIRGSGYLFRGHPDQSKSD